MSAPKPPCCGACKDKQKSCRVDMACCLECHFSYEEKHCFPYLPPSARHIIKQEHRRLKKLGYPDREVAIHAEDEMRYFRAYCPPDLVAQIDRDHAGHGEGILHSRRRE